MSIKFGKVEFNEMGEMRIFGESLNWLLHLLLALPYQVMIMD